MKILHKSFEKKTPQRKEWLNARGLGGTDATLEKYKTRKEWLNARGIGGTDASAILGKSPYKTPYDIINEHKHNIKPKDIDNEVLKRGRKSEKPMLDLFKIDFPQYEVIYRKNTIYRHNKYPYLTCSLDGELHNKENGLKGIWEGKTTDKPSLFTNGIPENYRLQILHNLMITGFDFAILDVRMRFFNSCNEVVKVEQMRYFIYKDDNIKDMISNLETTLVDFYKRYIIGNELPAITI